MGKIWDVSTQSWIDDPNAPTPPSSSNPQGQYFDPSTQSYQPNTANDPLSPAYAQSQQSQSADPNALGRADFGVPGYDALQEQLQDRAQSVLGRTDDSDIRQRQMSLADQYQRYASGQDSISKMQLQQAAEANMAQQLAMAAGARPGQSQLAALTAAQQVGSINTGLAGQQAMAGLAERQQAANALGSLLGQTRGMDQSFQQQQDTAYQQALAQRLALAELAQRGTSNYSTYLTNMLQLQKQYGTGWDKAFRGLSDLAGAYSSISGKSGGSGSNPYQSAQDAAMDMIGGGGG